MSIYVIDKSYFIKIEDDKPLCQSFSGSNLEIIEELKTNKGYHQLFKSNENYTLFFDLDHVINDEITSSEYLLHEIRSDISEYLDIDINGIYYTESKKSDSEYSYHISIPSLYGSLECFKTIAQIIKNDRAKFTFGYFVDDTVYSDNRWYRLPNQTNYEKPIPHIVKYGSMIDFINFHIPKDSEKLVLNNKIKQPIKQPKKQKTTKKLLKDQQEVKKLTEQYTDEQILELLNKLDESYLDDYDKWSIITNMMKSMDKKELWDKWSQGSDKYNKYKNDKIWRGTKKLVFDIRYLLKLTKTEQDINYYKPYISLVKDYPKVEKKQINHYRLHDQDKPDIKQYSYDDLNNNDTIIIKSCTGTGKTTANAKLIKQYFHDNPNKKIISIISRVSLGYQIIEAFGNKDINIKIDDYKTKKFKPGNNYNVCINSLLKLEDISPEDLNDYVIYIDEINSFIKHFTHNQTIDKDLKDISIILFRIIKHAHKVIVSDAEISDGVFLFLKNRLESNTIYIENQFKKYSGIDAIRINNEHEFLELLEQNIKSNNYFLFGCDSCTIIERYYLLLKMKYDLENMTDKEKEYAGELMKSIIDKELEEDENSIFKDFSKQINQTKLNNNTSKFLLYTSNVDFIIKNASEEFYNKFVFYSPSIETAIDVSLKTPQDVFIYIKGNTIDASSSFQQLSRTRNIRKVYYYCETKDRIGLYENLEETKKIYDDFILHNEHLTNVCEYIDENDDMKLSKNSFYELFLYNEYVYDIYQTSRLKHFQDILRYNEFNLIDIISVPSKINPIDSQELEELRTKINEQTYNEYIVSENKNDHKFNEINKIVDLLHLPKTKTILEQYKNEIIDDSKRMEHLNLIRFFKNDEYIKLKIDEIECRSINVKCYKDIYHKIKLFRDIEKNNNISMYDINFNNVCINSLFICNNWEYIQKVFRITAEKPERLVDFNKTYISLIKHITSKDIIFSKKIRIDKTKTKYIYDLDQTYIKNHIELNKYCNQSLTKFIKIFYTFIDENDDVFLDDE
jgi:hypothetical protein